MSPTVRPTLRMERSVLRAGSRIVVGMDEVGRGALAGPVSVGAFALDLHTSSAPRGVADSKLLSAQARHALLPALGRWGMARAVGHASPGEIDTHGIVGALRLAGLRSLAQITACVGPVDVVVLDGSHDWLTGRGPSLFDDDDDGVVPRVVTQVQADRTCASVAAASVLAKCERDALMAGLHEEFPPYCWDQNKGYGAPEHLAALAELGPSPHHRTSWRLPGVPQVDSVVASAGHGG